MGDPIDGNSVRALEAAMHAYRREAESLRQQLQAAREERDAALAGARENADWAGAAELAMNLAQGTPERLSDEEIDSLAWEGHSLIEVLDIDPSNEERCALVRGYFRKALAAALRQRKGQG